MCVCVHTYQCVDDKEQVNRKIALVIGTFNNNVNFILNRACRHYKADNEKDNQPARSARKPIATPPLSVPAQRGGVHPAEGRSQ